ncbi:MAG: response regulator [Flavobacterium sp.]
MSNFNKILVIEDNLGDFVLIEEFILEKFSETRVLHCDNYEKALDFLQTNVSISAILLDIHLPDYHEKSLVQDIKEKAGNIPIIVLTGYSDLSLAHNCLTVGATDFLLKDEITPEILYKSILYANERMTFIESLEKEKENYLRLFSLSPQPMFLFDKETFKFININKAATEKYGYTPKEFLDRTLLDILPTSELNHFKKTCQEPPETSKVNYPQVFQHVTKSGKLIDVEIFRKDINYDGKNTGLVLINDITEKQKHLNTIEKQNIKLKKIAWNQSHTVRTPLSRILGIINLLEEGELNREETTFFLNQIKKSANELDHIVKEIVNETNKIN